MQPQLFVFSFVGFAGGGTLLYWGFKSFKLKLLVENMPTSKVRSLAMGLVEVFGKAVAVDKKILKSPFENKDCVFYRYTIEEYRRGKDRNYWATIRQGFDSIHFYLKDDTGEVLVDPTGAHVDIPVDFSYTTGIGKGIPPQVQEFLKSQRIRGRSILGLRKKLRFTEYVLEPKDQVYILGTAGKNPFVKNSSKNEDFLMIQKGENEKIFYISDREEEKLLKSLRNKSLVFLLIGAGLFLFGLTVTLINLGLF